MPQSQKLQNMLVDVFGSYSVSADGRVFFEDGTEIANSQEPETISNAQLALEKAKEVAYDIPIEINEG